MADFEVEGINNVINNLRKQSSNFELLANIAMEKSLQIVENKSKQNCPVDDGTLRASITHSIEIKGHDIVGKVGSNLEYAPYVHQGTGIHAINGDGREDPWSYQDAKGKWHRTVGQKPQPFIADAIQEKKNDIFTTFKEVLKQ